MLVLANGNLASGSSDNTIKIWDFSRLTLEVGGQQELQAIEINNLSLVGTQVQQQAVALEVVQSF